jgi:hypothetical protein
MLGESPVGELAVTGLVIGGPTPLHPTRSRRGLARAGLARRIRVRCARGRGARRPGRWAASAGGRRAAAAGSRFPVSLGRAVPLNNVRSLSRGSKITRVIRQRGKSNSSPLSLIELRSESSGITECIPASRNIPPESRNVFRAGNSCGMITDDSASPGITGHHCAPPAITRPPAAPARDRCVFTQHAACSVTSRGGCDDQRPGRTRPGTGAPAAARIILRTLRSDGYSARFQASRGGPERRRLVNARIRMERIYP